MAMDKGTYIKHLKDCLRLIRTRAWRLRLKTLSQSVFNMGDIEIDLKPNKKETRKTLTPT
jgi:hypothetical protein